MGRPPPFWPNSSSLPHGQPKSTPVPTGGVQSSVAARSPWSTHRHTATWASDVSSSFNRNARMTEAVVAFCCVDLAQGNLQPSFRPIRAEDKGPPGDSVAAHPPSLYLYREPRKRKRELRAAAGESPIRSSSAPSWVPRIFLGLEEELSWPFHRGLDACDAGIARRTLREPRDPP
jgi:hypothetical protein